MILFVGGDNRFVTVGIGCDCLIHRGKVEAGLLGGAREMIALVPALHRAVPQHARDRIDKGERAALELRHGA
jgi:hypothetical protein